MNDRILPYVAALAAVLAWAAIPVASRAQDLDLAPLLEVRPDLSTGVARAFPDYEALVLRGIQQSNQKRGSGGVVELVKKIYDTELDESNTWSVDATVTLFEKSEQAVHELDTSCYSFAHGGASAPVRSRNGVYCISPVLHMRTDPLRMYLPANVYSSWVLVRNDRVLVRLYERHVGSRMSAKNRIIAEIAERLSRVSPPAAP